MLNRRKIREVYEVLPKLNCGLCGYGNCGNYARAVAEGRAPPYLCQGGPYVAQQLSEVLGIKVPTFAYGLPRATPTTKREKELEALRREEGVLIQRVEELRRKVEGLKSRFEHRANLQLE